jgi:hypothetical protein
LNRLKSVCADPSHANSENQLASSSQKERLFFSERKCDNSVVSQQWGSPQFLARSYCFATIVGMILPDSSRPPRTHVPLWYSQWASAVWVRCTSSGAKARPVMAYLPDDYPRTIEVLDTAKLTLGIALAL